MSKKLLTADTQVYSTEETFTGKYWIDGKKIYRKLIKFYFSSLSGNLDKNTKIQHNISNIDNITSSNILFVDGQLKEWSMFPYTSNDGTVLGYRISKSYINFYGDDNYGIYQNRYLVITVEYTKTTD